MQDREVVAEQLHYAADARKEAMENYRRVVIMAKHSGWKNTEIARAVGVSEAAIRRYWKRINPGV